MNQEGEKMIKEEILEEEPHITMTKSEIMDIIYNYDRNNANQVRSAGALEYTLFENVAKKFMYTQYDDELKDSIDAAMIYPHDSAQELYKGINCLSGNNRIIIKDSNGNVSYCKLDEFVNNKFDKDTYYVPTINTENGVMEWKKVINAYSSGVKPVYKLKFSKGLTIECTNDHKFIKASSKTKNNYYFANKRKKYVSLDDGLTKEVNVLSNYKIDYNSDNNYYESALFGFFLGDGTFNKHNKSIRFSFIKRDKSKYLEYLCNKLNLTYTKTDYENGYVFYSFNGLKGDVWYSKSELIEKYFNKLNLKGVFEGLLNSDGSLVLDGNDNVRINYVSTNKEIIDLWNLCLLCLGLKHSFHSYKHNDVTRKECYSSTSTGNVLKEVLNNIYLRDSFYNKFINSSDNKKEYCNNARYVLKDYEYIGIKETYNLSIEDNHNYMAGIGGFLSVKNCFTLDPRFILRKGVYSNGDAGHLGCVTKPAKHFNVAIEHLAQTLGLASTCIAGGVAIASLNCFLAPYITDLDDKEIYQVIQAFAFQMNEAFKNRGCVSGDTKIWCKIDNEITLISFNELSDLLEAEYGENNIPFKLEVLTVDNDRNIIWHEATSFWRNEPRDLYEVKLNRHKSFVCDDKHGLIRFKNLDSVNIMDIKKGSQLCKPNGLYPNIKIVKNNDYYDGLLSGFYAGDGYKTTKHKAICVGKVDKKEFIKFMFNKLNIEFNSYERLDSRYDSPNNLLIEYRFNYDIKDVNDYLDNPSFLAGWLAGFTSSDGSISIGTSGFCDIQYTNTNIDIINTLKYILFYFNIVYNCNIKTRKNYKPNWNTAYRINIGIKNETYNLFNQLDLRETQKDNFLKSKFSNYNFNQLSRTLCKEVTPLQYKGETFCLTVNGRMIIGEDFILTNNSQSLFSSINLDLEMPKFIKEQPAVGPEGKYTGKKYEDYQEEAKKLAHIITEVFLEGDGANKPLFFPNLIYNIDGADLSEWDDVFDLTAKFSSPYFSVPSNNNGVEYASVLGCRTSIPSNWTGDPNIDCMGTGNAVYTTISLPAVALKAKEDGINFFKLLEEQMEIVRKYTLKRYERIKWLWYEQHLADFMIQELDGKPLYRLEDATLVIGYLGLSNAMEILYGKKLHEDNESARKIMIFMRDKIAEYKKEDKLRWGLFQTPAENCCHSLAKKMVDKYGFEKSKAKGTPENPYYTNSNHIDVDANINILDRIRIEGYNQPLGAAGNIMNLYTSEAYSDPIALRKLVTRIRDLTSAYFFAITGEYSICPLCGTTYRGNKDKCIFDDAECDCISRITGYLGNILSWNDGKKEEFKDRKRY